MLLMAFVYWWYGAGWAQQIATAKGQLSGMLNAFSVGMLLRTLFSPFRQISVGTGGSGPLEARVRAWFDRLLSRFIGAMVRSVIIFIGIGGMLVTGFLGVFRVVLWPVIPLLPVVFVLLGLVGWKPW